MPSSIPLRIVLSGLLSFSWIGCTGHRGQAPANPTELRFTFEEGTEDWRGDVVDYGVAQEDLIHFTFERRALPPELGAGHALFLSGNNRSDDLFMYLTRPVSGLRPATSYDITFELTLGSNAGSGCVGIGGAPGESVFLKVGAANVAPERVKDPSDFYRLNLDKGNQSEGGPHAQVIGNVANGDTDCSGETYRSLSRNNLDQPFRITSDGEGRLWLLVGTDSGYEGTSAFYYDTIRIVLKPSPKGSRRGLSGANWSHHP